VKVGRARKKRAEGGGGEGGEVVKDGKGWKEGVGGRDGGAGGGGREEGGDWEGDERRGGLNEVGMGGGRCRRRWGLGREKE